MDAIPNADSPPVIDTSNKKLYYWIYQALNNEIPSLFTGVPIGMLVNVLYGGPNIFFKIGTVTILSALIFNFLLIGIKSKIKEKYDFFLAKAKGSSEGEIKGHRPKAEILMSALNYFPNRKAIKCKLIAFPAVGLIVLITSVTLIIYGTHDNSVSSQNEVNNQADQIVQLKAQLSQKETRIEKMISDSTMLIDSLHVINHQLLELRHTMPNQLTVPRKRR